jgi:hypothetical protein
MYVHPSIRPSIHPSIRAIQCLSTSTHVFGVVSKAGLRHDGLMVGGYNACGVSHGNISKIIWYTSYWWYIYIYNIYIYTHLGNPEVHNFRRQAKITCFLPFRLVFAVWSWDTRALFYSLGERYHHTHVKKKVVVELNVYLNFGKTCCSIVRHARLAKGLATVSAFCFFPSTCIADSPWSTATHDIKVVQSMGAK